ncbi:MAG TPA: stage V sporulation protein B [Peptococcaceae bacterium]|nr:stage V sporulation protein B [Peptococcaceae bacterium]
MPYNKLVLGAIILFVANLINRILGFIYQYLIMHYIGSEAYGLFHMVFPVYMTALVFTTAGIPLAVSKMVSEKAAAGYYADAQKTFCLALITLFFSGLFVSLILFINAAWIVGRFFADKRVLVVFQICIPAIFVVAIASAFRGYFQGLQNMIPSALSQISEQIFRVIVGFTLSLKLLAKGIEWAAAGLAAGMLGGEMIGLIIIFAQYLLGKDNYNFRKLRSRQSARTLLRGLITLSLPVTGSRLMASAISALEAIIIPRQLQVAGFSARAATSLFGQLSGTAMTLLTFPSVFTFALSTSLVPAISEAIGKKDYKLAKSRCIDAIRYTVILGLPCVIALYYFSEPFTAIFNSKDVAGVLKILALGGLFTYVQQTTTGILQGLGKTYLPLLHSIITAFFRLPLLFYLTGLPKWGLLGCSFTYVLGYFCMATLNLMAIKRNIGMTFNWKTFLFQPFTAGLGMLGVLKVGSDYVPITPFTCLVFTGLGFIVYLFILFLNGGLCSKDLKKISLLRRMDN